MNGHPVKFSDLVDRTRLTGQLALFFMQRHGFAVDLFPNESHLKPFVNNGEGIVDKLLTPCSL